MPYSRGQGCSETLAVESRRKSFAQLLHHSENGNHALCSAGLLLARGSRDSARRGEFQRKRPQFLTPTSPQRPFRKVTPTTGSLKSDMFEGFSNWGGGGGFDLNHRVHCEASLLTQKNQLKTTLKEPVNFSISPHEVLPSGPSIRLRLPQGVWRGRNLAHEVWSFGTKKRLGRDGDGTLGALRWFVFKACSKNHGHGHGRHGES